MPNYFTSTRNPIARAGIIRKLLAKGYMLYNNKTPSDYFKDWPAELWPIVVVRTDGSFALKPTIDLIPSLGMVPVDFVQVSPARVEEQIPNACNVNKPLPVAPVFPEPAKYSIEYMKADGSVGNYMISNPIEATSESVTAYAFGKGIRTFKKARVRSFSKVG